MSDNGSDDHETATEHVLSQELEESTSVEPSMSEWSSLEQVVQLPNPKKVLYEQGLYDPGSGEVCATYITQSDSDIFRHVYYSYPCLIDPGITQALLEPASKIIYPDNGQDLYLALCKEMNQCPVRIFHRALLGDKVNLNYYCVNPNGVHPIAKALHNNKTVKVLDLTDNFLNDDACFHLGEMLIYNATLSELNLSGCRIGESGACRLCAGLPTNRTLTVLNLSRNQLGDGGVEHFANAVFWQSDVRKINLSYNGISGKGAQVLAEALERHNKLTNIDLSRNNLYTPPSGLVHLLDQLASGPLEYLNLSWNALCGLKPAEAIKSIFLAKNLKHLDISNNKLSTTEVVTSLIGFMAKPKKMITYNVSYNPIDKQDALMFINKLQMRAVKLQVLNMDGIHVDDRFIRTLKAIKKMKNKENVVVTHGYVEHKFTSQGPDPREVVLNRAEYVCKKMKPKQDIALLALQLHKEGNEIMALKDLIDALSNLGVGLDDDLVAELQCTFPGPVSKKGAKRIDITMWAEYVTRKWPERKLPKTPPPEPEPIPVPEPVPDKKTKGKGKGAGKKK